jgi:CheY-like chemotaxis protein
VSTILIIDDNKAYREGLIELLNLEGYMTLEAENGLFGLQIIQEYLPDLILCDVDMPVMNGIEILQSLRNDPKFSMIPFLILSGGSDERAVQIGKDLEMGAYLTKGLSISDLLSKIAHFLSPTIQSLKT